MKNVLAQGLEKYVGEWVVICKDHVIAHNRDLRKIKKDIDECKSRPLITKIPKSETLIF
ncbi:hypothetical protein HY492_00775 [Candidatus Woesearchaeota archaeon]|nr:hypothetical protein [Candidatus Woesearchaeota archaeon]